MAGVLLGFASCKKDDPKPSIPCNCGLILSDDVTDYSVIIRNDCSGNEKKFYLSQGDWMNAHPGNNFCITNVSSWTPTNTNNEQINE